MTNKVHLINGNRVVMVVFPLQGHINPMLELASLLHSKGLSITIAHPTINAPNPSNHPEFDYLPFAAGDLFSCGFELTNSDGQVDMKTFAASLLSFNDGSREVLRKEVERLMKDEEEKGEGRVGGIVYDQFVYCAQDVAKDLNLPGISLRTSAGVTLLAFSGWTGDQKDSPEDLEEIFKELTRIKTHAMLDVRAAITKAYKSSTAILVNTMEFLEHQGLNKARAYFSSQILPIGPFHKLAPKSSSSNSLLKEDTSCISWLDKQKPKSVLYVSFGSLAKITAPEFMEVVWGLEASEQPFLWVIRPGLVIGGWDQLLPESFQETVQKRGCIVSWAPQTQVLAHQAIGGFWTHCGWNSTLESICEGVPMLCKPSFGDQFVNTKYITSVWKVGLELKDNKIERGEIERCVRRLIGENEDDEMRQRAMILKEKAELCLKEEGSSQKYLNKLVDIISSI
ncbi:UDP-glucose iridoid glucosyltransferase-like protein [Drosera capensis]